MPSEAGAGGDWRTLAVSVNERTEPHRAVEIPLRNVRIEIASGHPRVTPVEAAVRASIGSATDCDVVLGDPTVSRYHAEVMPEGGPK